MKRATITRGDSTDEGTFGLLALDDGPRLMCLELPWRDNATGTSCIPKGLYRCEIVNSPRFGKVYEVRDVPGRVNILIHAANFAGDTAKGFFSQLLGCIAPATAVGALRTPAGKVQRAGMNSKVALATVMAWGSGAPFELEIR